MLRMFKRGLSLLAGTPALVTPVLVFLLSSQLLHSPGLALDWKSQVWPQLRGLLLNTPLLALAALAFSLHMTSVFFSNADMFLALEGRKDRYKTIFVRLGLRWLLLLLLAAAVWTSAFCIVGLATFAVLDTLLPGVWGLACVAAIGAALFPLYYLGISLGSLALIIGHMDRIPLAELFARMWNNRFKAYRYYATRSVIDSMLALGVPAAVAFLVSPRWLGLALTVLIVGVFMAFVRASFMVFKREVLLALGSTR